ncbi:response regulator [Ferruginibacter albus]|uniref:response regulator n=1 Tax=Ferruginibacter albus TaxID=2875540 RepID=UPI001CC5601A|nr:response regulator [Ferruginibacter albus]UAY52941.1 response regulator [Ferruginibacter albus]
MKRSILAIDGSKPLRYLITTLFAEKFLVHAVEDNFKAIQMINTGFDPDLIVIDIPGIGSENLEMLEHISTSSIFKNVHVIVLSAENDEELKNVCMELGANDFLTKPFDPVYLYNKTEQLLSKGRPDVIHQKRKLFNNLNMF